MCNVKRSKFGASLAAVLFVLMYGNRAEAGEDMLVLIDQSGSMFDSSVAGAPRWVVARQLAADVVNAAAADREYSLWIFQDYSYTNVVPFSAHATQAQIVAAIWALPGPTGSTPLAGSICDAVDELMEYMPTLPDDKRLELFSDGMENSTPPAHECYGPASVDHASPDVGSWEWKVFNKVQTGSAASAAEPPIPLIVNADYLFEHEPAIFSPFSADPVQARGTFAERGWAITELEWGPVDLVDLVELPDLERMAWIEDLQIEIPSSLIRSQILEGIEISDLIAESPVAESQSTIGFYRALTDIAGEGEGGRYREFSSATPRLPQLGDVTGDYCVNDEDIDLSRQNWGTPVAADNLLDQNQDHTIDRYDYMTVLQNYGAGCDQ